MSEKKVVCPEIIFHGPVATHNLKCWLCGDDPSVYYVNDYLFRPCWKCQSKYKKKPWWKLWTT